MATNVGNFETDNIWVKIGNLVFGFVRLGALLGITTLPIFLLCIGVKNPLNYFGLFLGALWLSSPGLTAAFAAFRDSPDLGYSPLRRSGEAEAAIAAGWVAPPRWQPEEEHRIIRPYFRVYFQLAPRTLLVSAILLGIAIILMYDWHWLAQSSGFHAFAPAFLVSGMLAICVAFTAMAMVVEFPKARLGATLRNAAYLSVRKWYLTLMNLFIIATWLLGTFYAPIVMPVLGTPLLLHLIWANCRWMTMPLIKELEAEAVSA